jgi:UDP-glucose 4-epimerase
MRSSTVLVTGGAGFIGSHLVDELDEAGHAVRVLDDLFTGSPENVNPAAELTVASVSDHDAVRSAVDSCDTVFHIAAHRAVQRSVENPLATDLANVHGTLTLLAAAHEAGVRRVVSASSSSVYGGADTVPTPETEPLVPRSPYAVSKMASTIAACTPSSSGSRPCPSDISTCTGPDSGRTRRTPP